MTAQATDQLPAWHLLDVRGIGRVIVAPLSALACRNPARVPIGEWRYLQRFSAPNRRLQSYCGLQLANSLVRGVSRGCGAKQIEVVHSASGAPRVVLDGDIARGWHISLSHSGPYVACAFTCGADESSHQHVLGIGVDLEQRDASRGLAPRQAFTSSEWTEIEGAGSEDARQHIALEFWTRKEAVAKASGLRLAEVLGEELRADSGELRPTKGRGRERMFFRVHSCEVSERTSVSVALVTGERSR